MGGDSSFIQRIDDIAYRRAIDNGTQGDLTDLMEASVSTYLDAAYISLDYPDNPLYTESLKCINRAIEMSEINIVGYNLLSEDIGVDDVPEVFENPSSLREQVEGWEELEKYANFASKAKEVEKGLKDKLESENSLEQVENSIYGILEIAEDEGIRARF